MKTNRSVPPVSVVPMLVYPDVRAAVAWLTEVFGFVERTRIGADHRAAAQHRPRRRRDRDGHRGRSGSADGRCRDTDHPRSSGGRKSAVRARSGLRRPSAGATNRPRVRRARLPCRGSCRPPLGVLREHPRRRARGVRLRNRLAVAVALCLEPSGREEQGCELRLTVELGESGSTVRIWILAPRPGQLGNAS